MCECDRLSHTRSQSHTVLVPGAGLEPAQPLWPQDFKSCVSTIPPSGLLDHAIVQSCDRSFARRTVISFLMDVQI
jgi:hypothetical protein